MVPLLTVSTYLEWNQEQVVTWIETIFEEEGSKDTIEILKKQRLRGVFRYIHICFINVNPLLNKRLLYFDI